MFVDRVRELEMLEDRYRSDQAELFVLYGRRRVGKTELLAQLCQDKPHIFFVADYDVEAVLRASLRPSVSTCCRPCNERQPRSRGSGLAACTGAPVYAAVSRAS